MPQADGTILIDTEINADGMKAGSKEVEAAVRRMASSVNDLGAKAKTALNKQVDSFIKLNQEFSSQSRKADELKKKVSEYGNQKIPTDEYSEIQKQIEQATVKMNRLIAQQDRFKAMGGSEKSSTYKRYQYDIDELANTIKYAKGELQDLEEKGQAFTFGSKTKEAAADMERLESAERKLANLNDRLGTSYSSIKGQVNDYKKSLLQTDSAQKKASNSGNRLSKSLSSTGKAAKSAQFGLGKMLGTSLLFSFVFRAISAATQAIKDGFTNLAQYSGTTNNSISMLWSSLERLKNSLATAFAPILDVIAPILSKFIDMISTAASYVSMFFAFLSGKSTYTRAVAVQKDYAASLQDTAGSAEDLADSTKDDADATKEAREEAERYLSPLDDINRYSQENADSGNPTGGGSGGSGRPGSSVNPVGSSEGPLFEEVPIDNKFASLLDSVLDKLKKIRDIFMSGFWDGLGDYKPLLEELQSDLRSIGNSLKEIFTDPGVQAAASKFVKSFIYNLGRIVGAATSIGLSIAVNLVGGIESYLSRNVDRIKKFLISMFNIGDEILNQLGLSAQIYADIFSGIFSSQLAQNLTGNIIGIFSSIGMLAMEVLARMIRDNIYLITQPWIENKELIKEAVLNTIAPIQEIAQAFEDFLNETGDKIVEFYDSKIKPFVDSVVSGISDIYHSFLSAYNEYIAPILDRWADKIKELIDGPITEFVNKFLKVMGQIIDILKFLWEDILQPIIQWIVENVIPIIAPIVESLGDIVIDFVGFFFEAANNILDALSGVIDFIVGIFTGDWERAWQGVRQIFSSIFGSLVSIVRNPINSIIRLINGAISGINTIISGANKLPGINIPTIGQIPYLASGAVIPPNKEFMAVLGDQTHGNNIEAPESLIRKIVREESGGSGNKYEVVAKVGRKELFRMMIDEAKMQRVQTGRNPFELA